MHANDSNADERGVSPVIGVILMVAITVVLAATAASFFLGIGQEGTSTGAPTAAFSYTFAQEGGSHVLTISHRGGDTVRAATLAVIVSGADCQTTTSNDDPDGRYAPRANLGYGATEVSAGSILTLNWRTLRCGTAATPGDLRLDGATVTVAWVSPEGGTSDTLWRWQGPSA